MEDKGPLNLRTACMAHYSTEKIVLEKKEEWQAHDDREERSYTDPKGEDPEEP